MIFTARKPRGNKQTNGPGRNVYNGVTKWIFSNLFQSSYDFCFLISRYVIPSMYVWGRTDRLHILNFTSMFVERMEVLEYRQKIEVELSTFPDSTNTETSRKQVFSFTCACVWVCVCAWGCVRVCVRVCVRARENVFQWISYERVDGFEWKFRCMLQLASNREPSLASTIGSIFLRNLGREGWFLQLFEPLYLKKKHYRYRKTEKT